MNRPSVLKSWVMVGSLPRPGERNKVDEQVAAAAPLQSLTRRGCRART